MLTKKQKIILVIIAVVSIIGLVLFLQNRWEDTGELKTEIARMPFGIPPTGSQRKALMAIDAKYAPKIKEIKSAIEEIYSPKQKEAKLQAFETIRKKKLEGKAARVVIEKAMTSTPDQLKKESELYGKLTELFKQMRSEITNLLTPDQHALLIERMNAPRPK
ncbi:MAG: hypothetical protein EBR01_10550 [Proteobacteria bacterium]|nr:hypothetical protein [Pseudomonadota bacterium]